MATKKPKAEKVESAAPAAAEVIVLPPGTPKSADLMADVQIVCDSICAVAIDSPVMYELAALELIELQAKLKEVNDKRFLITRPMDAAKNAVMALFKPATDQLEKAITSLKGSMLEYDRAQKKKAEAQQLLLDQIAANQRAALAAEQARQDAEAAAQLARAQELAEAGDDDAAAEAITRAEQAQEMAVALQATTQVVSAAVAKTDVPTVAGVATADVWQARVTDLPALLRFVADHPEYHAWIELKMTGLHEMAKAQRDALRIPGVEAFEETRLSAGSGLRKAA